MADRFYHPAALDAESLELTGPEAHHLARVMRKQPGDEAILFDGQGHSRRATIDEVSKKSVRLIPAGAVHTQPLPTLRLELHTAVPKGDRFKWLVEKATELGVARLVPLQCERSVVAPRGGKLDKLRLAVIEACKQCRRDHLMTIADSTPFTESLTGSDHLFIADPTGDPPPTEPLTGTVRILIGPEGGFTPEELAAATAAGARPLRIATSILRIETAAVATASWFGAVGLRDG